MSIGAASAGILVALFLSLLSSTTSHAAQDVPVGKLLTSVQQTLIRVRDKSSDVDLPPLSKVTLILKATIVEEAVGKISLAILEVGGNASRETIQEIELELRPPRPADKAPVSAQIDALAEAIIEAARAVKQAQIGRPPLHLGKLTARLQFVAKVEGSAGINFALLPVTAALSVNANQANTQTVVLEFEAEQ